MSESELEAILKEIRSRGQSDEAAAPKNEVEDALASFSITKKDAEKPADPKPAQSPFSIKEEPISFAMDDVAPPVAEPKKEKIEAPEPEPKKAEPDLDMFGIEPPKAATQGEADLSVLDIPLSDDEYDDTVMNDAGKSKPKSKKPIIIAIVAIIVLIAAGVGLYFGVFAKDKAPDTNEPTTQTVTKEDGTPAPAVDQTRNPLTGEAGYNEAALDQRPVAVVVENEYSSRGVRPQWGINEADILLEGEAEFSTRTLLFWADYNTVPKQVGPTRSARPPFIHFSQLFDAVFIHAGLSRSKGSYVGADSVFKNEGIDHINLLSYSTDGTYMGRDYSRTSTVEHTGYLNGTNCAKLLESANINTKLNPAKFTTLSFNTEAQSIGSLDGKYAYFKWSSNCPDTIEVNYDAEDDVYVSDHFDSSLSGEKANVKWTNCIFLFDDTTYVVKDNYKQVGHSETYCNYSLAGGKGVVMSHGTAANIKWGVSNGKLWMKNADTNEDITLNPGKSYIGYGSSNHGGSITLTKESTAE